MNKVRIKYVLVLVAILFFSSCSTSSKSQITAEQKKYIDDIIECASGSDKFIIINDEDLEDLFSIESDDIQSSTVVGYYSHDVRGEVAVERSLGKNKEAHFKASFKRKTYPFTKCRKFKTDKRFFK